MNQIFSKKYLFFLIIPFLFSIYFVTFSYSAESCAGDFECLQNPLKDSNIGSISDLISTILNLIMILAVPFIVIAIVYSGFLFIQAQGNPEKIKTARSFLLWSLVGAGIVLGANVIYTVMEDTFKKFIAEEGIEKIEEKNLIEDYYV